MKNKARISGFTLIELLVVIAIIGLLSSVIFVSVNTARKRSRDNKRMSDLRQIVSALQIYQGKYGYIPRPTSYGEGNSFDGYNTVDTSVEGDYLTFLKTDGIINTSFRDPLNIPTNPSTQKGYFYGYECLQVTGETYANMFVWAWLEDPRAITKSTQSWNDKDNWIIEQYDDDPFWDGFIQFKAPKEFKCQ